MKLIVKKFPKELLKKYTVKPDNIKAKDYYTWDPNISAKGKKEVIDSVKKLLHGSVIYFKEAIIPDDIDGYCEAYLIPTKVFWKYSEEIGRVFLHLKGDVVYVKKESGGVRLFKSTDINQVVPYISIKTIKYSEFTSILNKLTKSYIGEQKI